MNSNNAKLVGLFREFSDVDRLWVPAIVDLDDPAGEVRPYARFVAIGTRSRGGYLVFHIDTKTGQLRLGEQQVLELPAELTAEPSVEPRLLNLTSVFLDTDRVNSIVGVSLYLDKDSDVESCLFRAAVLSIDDGRVMVLDPFWTTGIRIGGVWDREYIEQNSRTKGTLDIPVL